MRRHLTSRPKQFIGAPLSILVSTTPVGINANSIPQGASGAIVGALVADLAWGYTNVTTESGIPLKSGEHFDFDTNDPTNDPGEGFIPAAPADPRLSLLRFVRITSTDGRVAFQFYTEP